VRAAGEIGQGETGQGELGRDLVQGHAWIVGNGDVASAPVREVGVVTDPDTDDAGQWVTELEVPLAT